MPHELSPDVELLDVVDPFDRIIGQAPRAVIHRRRWRHRAVHILVFDERGRLYVQRRAPHKDCAPDRWDTSAAGHVDAGESYAQAAVRELAEELAVTDALPEPFWRLAASADTGNEFVEVYRCVSAQTPRPDPAEISEGAWYDRADLDAWLARAPADFTRTFRAIYQHLRMTRQAAA